MIASFSNNFIFIKTRKTGGTSVEIVLSTWCSGHDICIPITAEDEILRRAFGGQPMNFCQDGALSREFLKALDGGDPNVIDAGYRRLRAHLLFRNHDPASKVKTALPDLWRGGFTFAVDRHPYEKVISLAYWRLARRWGGDTTGFSAVLEDAIESEDYVNYPLYADTNGLLVDAVFRYEDMWKEIGALGARIGRLLPKSLPTAKARFRQDRRPARELLSPSQRQRISEKCAPEFELLGWSQ